MEIIEVKQGRPLPHVLYLSQYSKVVFEQGSLTNPEELEGLGSVARKFLVAEINSLASYPDYYSVLWLKKGSALPTVIS